MRAWVMRRWADGALLPESVRIGATPAPFELLVVNTTDQGRRRAIKLARLFEPGSKAILAELEAPHLVWFKQSQFVLSGTEVSGQGVDKVYGYQTWLCRLSVPEHAVGWRGRCQYERGVALPWRQVSDRYATIKNGELLVHSVLDETLGRHTTLAQMFKASAQPQSLFDCELDFIGEQTFQLSGFEHHAASEQRPARQLRQGWLCDYDLQLPPDPGRR